MFYRHPLFRLLALSLFVLGLGAGLFGGMQWMGSQQRYITTNVGWMVQNRWAVGRLAPEKCNKAGWNELLRLGRDWTIWVDLQSLPIMGWQAVCPKKPFELGTVVFGPPLAEIVQSLGPRNVIFNLRAQDPRAAEDFMHALDQLEPGKKEIGIASPSQSLLRTLRKLRPQWLYSSDAATWTKLKIFSGLRMEAAADLWPDFFVASTDESDPSYYSMASAKEILRRKKVIILDWDGVTPIPAQWKENLTGFLTNRPKKIPADTFFQEMGAK